MGGWTLEDTKGLPGTHKQKEPQVLMMVKFGFIDDLIGDQIYSLLQLFISCEIIDLVSCI